MSSIKRYVLSGGRPFKNDQGWLVTYEDHRTEVVRLERELAEMRAEIDNHHSEYCDQMRGPIGEQWRERNRPCTCWVGEVLERKP